MRRSRARAQLAPRAGAGLIRVLLPEEGQLTFGMSLSYRTDTCLGRAPIAYVTRRPSASHLLPTHGPRAPRCCIRGRALISPSQPTCRWPYPAYSPSLPLPPCRAILLFAHIAFISLLHLLSLQ